MNRIHAHVQSTCGHWTLLFWVTYRWLVRMEVGPCASCELLEEIRA